MALTADRYKRTAKIRRLLGGILIFYFFILIAIWFFDGYLYFKNLTPLPLIPMIVSVAVFVALYVPFRSARRSLTNS